MRAGALFSKKLSAGEKLEIIEKEYDIPTEDSFGKDVSAMCNLSLGIREGGIAIGEAKREARGIAIAEAKIIRTMYNNGFTPEQIATAVSKDVDEVRAILEKEEDALS